MTRHQHGDTRRWPGFDQRHAQQRPVDGQRWRSDPSADLRFTPDEAAAYFKDVMDLDLGARQLEVLEGRTEGWVAAL